MSCRKYLLGILNIHVHLTFLFLNITVAYVVEKPWNDCYRKYKDCVYGRCKYRSTWKNKEYLRSKDKAKNDMMYQDIYNCICQNTKKNENILSSMSNLQPNWCLKIDFQKVDQHAGGKWLIHDTKRRKDNQLQSLKLPCRISKLSS